MSFLWDCFLEHGTKSTAYVGFFLSYDFTQWFKTLPQERAEMLLTVRGRLARTPAKTQKRPFPFPVRYGEWEFDILGSKRFKIRKTGSTRWMNICDTGPFFQKSFISVIDPENWSEPVVTQEEFQTICDGKRHRSDAILDKDMRRYNLLENAVLPRVLERLNEGFQALGINLKPNQWFGPGQAAQAWLNGRSITSETLHAVVPSAVLESARSSYFGGWFEIMAHGVIPGITYEYDINSAYPHIISNLPCLYHGEWKHNGTSGLYTLVYAKVRGSNPYIGSMLHRDDKGNISRPYETEGWYWLHELNAAKSANTIDDISIEDQWIYEPCPCPAPLREVREIYALRKQVGKKTPLGIACKLVPNSLYGKFAQSVGSPKYANPVYASLITAGCRTMILNAIATHPEGTKACVMVATDGVYFTSPHPHLPVSGELGDWDQAEKKNLCLFKPGVYWDDVARRNLRDAKTPQFKARGINARDFSTRIEGIDVLFNDYLEVGEWPKVKFPITFTMITAVQALQRNDWSQAGAVKDNFIAQQSSDPSLKRSGLYLDGKIWRTSPRPNTPYQPSVPYQKRFGMDDPFGELKIIETIDGPASISFFEGLGHK